MAQVTTAPAERRQLTAFFCDLVGSTDLSTVLDAEDYFEILRAYHDRSDGLVASYGGHVAQHQGDGILAYFGYPRAQEDALERAIRCALTILDALADLNADLERDRGVRLAIRIGIHTGAVVLGEVGGGQGREMLAMGDTMNLAARLQGIAAPNTIVISSDSERLVHGLFLTEDLGSRALKGFSRPIQVYRVTGSTGIRGRLGPFGEAHLTPFIDREEPLGTLIAAWDDTRRGTARIVEVSGEPGIGKSRLVRAFRERCVDVPHVWLEAQCSQWAENTAFYPVIELQRRQLGIGDPSSAQDRLARFETALARAGLAVDEALPLVAALHEIPLPADRQPPPLSREAQRRKTLETLCAWLLGLGRDQPVVLVVEDVQWIDPSTAELIDRLLGDVRQQAVLTLFTHRSDAALPWNVADVLAIRLDRFGEGEATRVVEEVASREAMPPERVAEIVARGEGVPLYLEEVTKAALESVSPQDPRGGASERPASLTVPATLRDSLMARLDRLGSAKEVAQLASVIGREFSYALLAAAWRGEQADLRARLAQLVDSELVFCTGEPPDATYRFKHALIRDEAYQSLVKVVRREYHTRIGDALEAKFPEETAARPEIVGSYFLQGGNAQKGVLYLTMAARRAVTTSANVEALRHVERALAALADQPASPARTQVELALYTLRGGALIATRGYASKEVQEAFAQARERASALGDNPTLVPVLHGLWLFHMVRSDRRETVELADQLLAIAERSDDVTVRLFGLTVAGIQRFFAGQFRPAIDYIERAFALYDPALHRQLAVTYSLGTAGVARANAAACYWFLGYPDRARALSREVIAAARAERHPFTLAGVDVMSVMVFHLCGDFDTTRELAEEALAVATEQGFPLWVGSARAAIGWATGGQRSFDEGVAEAREGIARFRATGAETAVPYLFGRLGELCHSVGRFEEAEEAVDEGLRVSDRNFDGFYTAELWRLKGAVTLARSGDESSAQRFFERAAEIARAQEAKSLELRTAMSMARLAERRGDRRNAHEIVRPVYEWFTEGFDTADLLEARALLDRLRE